MRLGTVIIFKDCRENWDTEKVLVYTWNSLKRWECALLEFPYVGVEAYA